MSQLPQELQHLLQQLYAPSQPLSSAELALVQSALLSAQQRPEAWSYVASVLSDSTTHAYARFYAASTLSYKALRDLSTLTTNDRAELHLSTLRWLSQSCMIAFERPGSTAASERVVARKLASALALLVKQSKKRKEWPTWASDVVAALSSQVTSLLEVLSVLAEDDAIDANDIAALTLGNTLSSTLHLGHPACQAALRCLAALLTTKALPQSTISSLYPLLPPLLAFDDLRAAAASIIEDCLISCTSFSGFMGSSQVDELAKTYAGPLAPAFEQLSRGDGELDNSLIKLFATLMETLILDDLEPRLGDRTFQQLLRNLIHLATAFGAFPVEEEISNLGFPLWLLLQEEAAAASLGAASENQAAWSILRDAFATLLPALLGKIRWPDEASSWPKDICEQFETYRREANEVILAIYFVLKQPVVEHLVDQVLTGQGKDSAVEVAFFSLIALDGPLLKSLPGQEDRLAPLERIFSSYTFACRSDPHICSTELRFIASYAAFVASRPHHLLPLLDVVVTAMRNRQHARSAAKALAQLCKHCGSQLASHLGAFSDLVASSREWIAAEEYAALLGAVGSILVDLPLEQALPPMVSISSQVTEQLAADLARLQPAALPTSLLSATAFVAFAKSIARRELEIIDLDDDATTSIQQEGDSSFGQYAPAVEQIRSTIARSLHRLATFAANGDVELLEVLDELSSATTASNKPTPLSLDTLTVLEATSACSAQALWLLTASRLVSRIARDPRGSKGDQTRFHAAFSFIVEAALRACATSPDDAEVAQALFTFEAEVIRFLPRTLQASSDLVDASLSLCERTLRLPERAVLQSIVTFITLLIFDDTPSLRPSLLSHTPSLLFATLSRFVADHASLDPAPFAELLNVFITRLPDPSRAALHSILSSPDWPFDEDRNSRFLTAVMRARTVRTTLAAMNALVSA